MKRFAAALLALLAGAGATVAFAQGNSASLIDLTTKTVVSHFVVGDEPNSVAWASPGTAFVALDDGVFARIDMTTSPPTLTWASDYSGRIAINPGGTRAIIDTVILDLTTNPPSVAGSVPESSGAAFVAGGNRAVLIMDQDLILVDSINAPPIKVNTYPLFLPSDGLAVAVNSAGTRAAVTLDDTGGLQVIDLSSWLAPAKVGAPVGPLGADPLGVAISLDGRLALYVDESTPAGEANVVDISGAAPVVVRTIPLGVLSPSGVALNPATGEAVISGDDGTAIIDPSFSTVSAVITDPGYVGTSTNGIAVDPSGRMALRVNEDSPVLFTVLPQRLPFAMQLVNTRSGVQTVSVANVSVPVLTIRRITITGPFVFDTLCGGTLPKSQSCTISVQFAPAVAGAGQTGRLNVFTDWGNLWVDLTGDAFSNPSNAVAIFAIKPDHLDFGEVVINTTSNPKGLEISNPGNAPYKVYEIAVIRGPFKADRLCVGDILAGGRCTAQVVFSPVTVGPADGELLVSTGTSAGVVSVLLKGIGVPVPVPKIDLSSASLKFAPRAVSTRSAARELRVRNVGTVPLLISAVSLSSTAEFSLSSACPASLDPGKDCVVSVTFAPLGTSRRTAVLSIGSNDPDRPLVGVSLYGTGCRAFAVPNSRGSRDLCMP
ncbi:MAG TPA: choice-of-anchor D domain-containing protein [Usitatibacter sp.]|nr:choice-of-anchor D domain-containing protein [Usitatibacter sp.]